jgi:hypothetical protein
LRAVEDRAIDTAQIDLAAADEIRPELEVGETLLWAGKPDPRRVVARIAPMMVFGVLWLAACAVICLTATGAPTGGADRVSAAIMGVVFVGIGAALIGAPIRALQVAKATSYGITDKRILIVKAVRNRKTASHFAADLGDIRGVQRPDGSGDLIIARKRACSTRGGTRGLAFTLVGIRGVRDVENLARANFGLSEGRVGVIRSGGR